MCGTALCLFENRIYLATQKQQEETRIKKVEELPKKMTVSIRQAIGKKQVSQSDYSSCPQGLSVCLRGDMNRTFLEVALLKCLNPMNCPIQRLQLCVGLGTWYQARQRIYKPRIDKFFSHWLSLQMSSITSGMWKWICSCQAGLRSDLRIGHGQQDKWRVFLRSWTANKDGKWILHKLAKFNGALRQVHTMERTVYCKIRPSLCAQDPCSEIWCPLPHTPRINGIPAGFILNRQDIKQHCKHSWTHLPPKWWTNSTPGSPTANTQNHDQCTCCQLQHCRAQNDFCIRVCLKCITESGKGGVENSGEGKRYHKNPPQKRFGPPPPPLKRSAPPFATLCHFP